MIGDESSIGDDILAGRIEERGLVRRVDFNRTALGSAIFTEIPCAQSDPHYSAVIVPDLDDIIVRVTAKSLLLDLAALVLQPDGQFPRAQGERTSHADLSARHIHRKRCCRRRT